MGEKRQTMGVLDKALSVLQSFSPTHPDMTIEEIASRTRINRSSVQRVVFTLVSMGYLESIRHGKSYRIGARVLGISYSYLRNNRLLRGAMPELIRLANLAERRSDLVVLDDCEVVYLARIPGRLDASSVSPAGRRWTAVSSAFGRAILSTMPLEQREAVIRNAHVPKPTGRTITDLDEIRRKIGQAAKDGFAFQIGEINEGSAAIGAPVFGAGDHAFAAIGLGTIADEMNDENIRKELARLTREAAVSLSRLNIVD